MGSRDHSYEGEDIEVLYDLQRCIHAAECVHQLPKVFDPNEKPWIDADAADPELVAAVVECCPTGALHHVRKDDGAEELPDDENTIAIEAGGPLYLRGDLILKDGDGETILEDTRIALCRCGASSNKPFCDRAHVDASFADTGVIGEGGVKETAAGDDERLTINAASNGPLLIQGKFRLLGADGEERTGDVVALCRCGQSRNKPFCDGSHRSVGFHA